MNLSDDQLKKHCQVSSKLETFEFFALLRSMCVSLVTQTEPNRFTTYLQLLALEPPEIGQENTSSAIKTRPKITITLYTIYRIEAWKQPLYKSAHKIYISTKYIYIYIYFFFLLVAGP